MEAVWTRPATLNLVPTPSKGSSPCFWNHVWLTIPFHNSSICERFGLGELSVGPFGSLGESWCFLPKITPPFPTVSNDVSPASTQRCCPLRRLISSQRSSIHEPMRSDDGPARVGKKPWKSTRYPRIICFYLVTFLWIQMALRWDYGWPRYCPLMRSLKSSFVAEEFRNG